MTEKDKDGKAIEKKTRSQQYVRDLERIVEDFPNDIEAKAFLALALWEGERNDLPITSHVAVNALLQQVFDVKPMHPAHHFRIHLWDNQRAEMASAVRQWLALRYPASLICGTCLAILIPNCTEIKTQCGSKRRRLALITRI